MDTAPEFELDQLKVTVDAGTSSVSLDVASAQNWSITLRCRGA
jgi:hypothetical protein